jgi:3'(2'), 5'-bisphosphate nucleotidase
VDDAALAAAIAVEAGAEAVRVRQAAGPFDAGDLAGIRALKDAGDQATNALILQRLRAGRPGDAILSEEGADDVAARLAADRVWIVDPLDGTAEYADRRDDWAVQIALAAAGRLVAGAYAMPARGLVRTSSDPGATPAPLPDGAAITVVLSRTRPLPELPAVLRRLRAATGRRASYAALGGFGAKVEEVVAGRAHAYLNADGANLWDYAAPAAVALHYGYVVERFDGSPVAVRQDGTFIPDVLVAHPAVADAVRAAVRG